MAPAYRNRVLAALSRADLGLIEPHLEYAELPVRKVLEEPNKRIPAVCFLDSGIASVVAAGRGGREIEVGLIGREGMTGLAVVLGNHRSPLQTYIQSAGAGWLVRAIRLREALQHSPTMQHTMLKFAQAFMIQTAHTAAANGRARLDERLARWLLMAHDRSEADVLSLTHEFLGLMLGVRRAGVTVGLQGLESQGLINVARRQITILNRKGIETVAGPSYGVPEAELRRLFGRPGPE